MAAWRIQTLAQALASAAAIGAVTVPVNTRFKAGKLQYCLRQSDARLLFVADRFLKIDFIEMLAGGCPAVKRRLAGTDIRADVERIACPTLVITTTGSGLRSVDGVKAWVARMKNARLLVLEGDAWHAAGAYPDRCAQAALEFLAEYR